MAIVQDVLARKDSLVHTIGEHTTVFDAITLMNQHKIGAIVVTDADANVIGIFTERDVLRRVIGVQRDPLHTTVGQVMTSEVVCCRPMMPLEDVQLLMKQRRIRHMPVVTDIGKLLGIISIGDINAHAVVDHQIHIQYLQEYLYGRV
ncbi:MAG: CBS domain-containing protein [Phycisphaerales bacterium]